MEAAQKDSGAEAANDGGHSDSWSFFWIAKYFTLSDFWLFFWIFSSVLNLSVQRKGSFQLRGVSFCSCGHSLHDLHVTMGCGDANPASPETRAKNTREVNVLLRHFLPDVSQSSFRVSLDRVQSMFSTASEMLHLMCGHLNGILSCL